MEQNVRFAVIWFHWLTDKHDALQVTVLVIWSRESRKILIQRFLDNGAMPPGYIALTAIVKENYAYKISSDGFIYYILVGITFYDDTGKQIHMETFVDNDLTLGDVGKLKVNGRSGKKHKIQETFS